MTDKEIKLELAKAALKYGKSLQTCKGFYDWINEESDVVVEKPNDDFRNDPISEITKFIDRNGRSGGYGVRIGNTFLNNNITTVGELLNVGRRDVSYLYQIGRGALTRIDDALEELYGITYW